MLDDAREKLLGPLGISPEPAAQPTVNKFLGTPADGDGYQWWIRAADGHEAFAALRYLASW